ncbi:MAG: L-seryl-tRNA(Sec) selenium transferase [Candidatus Acidiferrales bacterium]
MKHSSLRGIPAVETILVALGETGLPRPTVVAVVRRELAVSRKQRTIPDFGVALTRIRNALHALDAARIRPVINGTGILAHTNFGRAPLGPAVIEALSKIGSHYNNLEYGLTGGGRGNRAAYLEHNLALLCGAEAATVVNNNAAALVLILRHICGCATIAQGQRRRNRADEASRQKNEVIISRGELIQIGGGFRIPEILEASGARLREIGTTNRTSRADYAHAITPETALILKVHRSNFFMGGFVESPLTRDIAALAHKNRVPFIVDLGSGAMIETQTIAGLEHEPTPAEAVGHGVDLVCFSGDKLLGGPQAGVIAGKAKRIAALKRDPFFRVLRCDKLILSALETIVDSYLRAHGATFSKMNTDQSTRLYSDVPVLEMLHASNDDLRLRAEKIIAALNGVPLKASVGAGRAQIGGGTLPRSVIASVTLDLAHPTLKPQEFAARLREHTVPVVGYVTRGMFKVDLRTVFPRQDAELISAIRTLVESHEMR